MDAATVCRPRRGQRKTRLFRFDLPKLPLCAASDRFSPLSGMRCPSSTTSKGGKKPEHRVCPLASSDGRDVPPPVHTAAFCQTLLGPSAPLSPALRRERRGGRRRLTVLSSSSLQCSRRARVTRVLALLPLHSSREKPGRLLTALLRRCIASPPRPSIKRLTHDSQDRCESDCAKQHGHPGYLVARPLQPSRRNSALASFPQTLPSIPASSASSPPSQPRKMPVDPSIHQRDRIKPRKDKAMCVRSFVR